MKKRPPTDKQILRQALDAALEGAASALPACRHFGDCGGCAFQDKDAGAQVAAKAATCRLMAERAGLGERLAAAPFAATASPRAYGYRQRMDYVCAFGRAGLRRRERFRQVVGLDECPLLGEQGFGAFRRALALAREAGWPDYDFLRHRGWLRYIVIRRTRAGEALASFVVKADERRDELAAAARTLLDEGLATGVYALLAPGLGDVSFGEPLARWGAETIRERLLGESFALGPNTFFQANPDVAELAYARIRGFAADMADAAPGVWLDLYSGTGTIARLLSCVAGAPEILAVESAADNVALMREQVALPAPGRAAVRPVRMDAAAFAKQCADARTRVALAVVNPPRCGVGPEGVAALAAIGSARLAYLSCNPATLWRDVAELGPAYRLRSTEVFDMFPQTPHFETLALLERVDRP